MHGLGMACSDLYLRHVNVYSGLTYTLAVLEGMMLDK